MKHEYAEMIELSDPASMTRESELFVYLDSFESCVPNGKGLWYTVDAVSAVVSFVACRHSC